MDLVILNQGLATARQGSKHTHAERNFLQLNLLHWHQHSVYTHPCTCHMCKWSDGHRDARAHKLDITHTFKINPIHYPEQGTKYNLQFHNYYILFILWLIKSFIKCIKLWVKWNLMTTFMNLLKKNSHISVTCLGATIINLFNGVPVQ